MNLYDNLSIFNHTLLWELKFAADTWIIKRKIRKIIHKTMEVFSWNHKNRLPVYPTGDKVFRFILLSSTVHGDCIILLLFPGSYHRINDALRTHLHAHAHGKWNRWRPVLRADRFPQLSGRHPALRLSLPHRAR